MRALKDIKAGQYLDIGASDPVVDSVSQAFYDLGWRGIHVEPLISHASQLKAFRLGDTVLQAAVSNQSGPITLYNVNDGQGISTVEADLADGYREIGFDLQKTLVPTLTLDQIFNSHVEGELHWMKIDVEGHEESVIRSWNDSPVRPWIIVVESTVPNKSEPNHENWEPLLLSRGYYLAAFDGLNRYYVAAERPELFESFTVPPNIFDNFVVAGPHWLHPFLPQHQRSPSARNFIGGQKQDILAELRKSRASAGRSAGVFSCAW